MEQRLMESDDFKAKDVFNVLSVCDNEALVSYLANIIEDVCPEMIPEEVVILSKLVNQHSLQGQLSSVIEKYLTDNQEEMETVELAKTFMSCKQQGILLSTSLT